MSYGFEIRNENDELVVDSEYPCLLINADVTLTGTVINTPFGERYSFPPQPNFLSFYVLEVGQYVIISVNGGIISNRQTLRIVGAEPANNIAETENYGISVFDDNGNNVFHGSNELLALNGGYVFTKYGNEFYETTANAISMLGVPVDVITIDGYIAYIIAVAIYRNPDGIGSMQQPVGTILSGYDYVSDDEFLVGGATIV